MDVVVGVQVLQRAKHAVSDHRRPVLRHGVLMIVDPLLQAAEFHVLHDNARHWPAAVWTRFDSGWVCE